MAQYKWLSLLLLVVVLDIWLCIADDDDSKTKNSSKSMTDLRCGYRNASSNTSNSGSYFITNASLKAPQVGKLQRLSDKNVGFIERSPGSLYPFSRKPLLAANNTWRIICDSQKTIFTIIMSLQLAYNDYLQIKLKKIDGLVDDRFVALHFSKKSVLVSLVSDNRNMFTSHSSFLLGYVCVENNHLEKAKEFFENEAVLQYMRCRPRAFEKIATELANYRGYYSIDTDIGNMLDLKNLGCLTSTPPECTSIPTVPDDDKAEGSAD